MRACNFLGHLQEEEEFKYHDVGEDEVIFVREQATALANGGALQPQKLDDGGQVSDKLTKVVWRWIAL